VTDFTLDPTTGLPELPEGQFWRVTRYEEPRRDPYSYRQMRSDNVTPTHVIHLIELAEELDWVQVRPKRLFRDSKYDWVPAIKERTLGSEDVGEYHILSIPTRSWHSKEGFAEAVETFNKKVEEAKEKLGERAQEGSIVSSMDDHRKVIADPTADEASILAAALRILESIEAKRIADEENRIAKEKAQREREAREARLNLYVGDYPPKMLLHD
jgi:hypothetical protein